MAGSKGSFLGCSKCRPYADQWLWYLPLAPIGLDGGWRRISLPLFDNKGRLFPKHVLDEVAVEFTERLGGLTAYTRSPAEGRWKQGNSTNHDDVVVLHVKGRPRTQRLTADPTEGTSRLATVALSVSTARTEHH